MVENAGIVVTRADARSIAGIGAFRDRAVLHAALQAEFAVTVPATPGFVEAGPVQLSCLGPGRYLASGPRDANLAGRLANRLAGLAAVTDQSDQWEVFVVSGRGVREVLARLVQVDVAAGELRVGDLALTRAGHLDVRVWRVADEIYEIAAARSYAQDLRYALGESC